MRQGSALLAVFVLLFPTAAAAQKEDRRPKAEYPAPSPNGSRVVYVSDVNGNRDLWIADASGANAIPFVATASDETHPAWSPDGAHVVFSSNRNSSKHQIWVVNADGTNPLALTSDNVEHEYPRYSPDGARMLYLSNGTGKREIWLMNADGSNQHPLALISTRVSDPAWAPNGEAIVYVGCRRGGACNLFRINSDASNGFQITSGNFQDWNPDWGTGGILFASNRGNAQGLWLVRPDGTGLQQITSPEGASDLDPHWASGNSFVFSRSGLTPVDGASDIWTATSATAASPERVTRTLVDTTPPVISPVVAGAAGNGGWYKGQVVVTWQVSDPESNIAGSAGCGPTTLSADTAGTSLTCSAQNGVGLSSSVSILIQIDMTPPAISGMPGSSCSLWPPNHKFVNVGTASAADAGSGLATFNVSGASSQPQAPADPDILISGSGLAPRSIQLRADRLGNVTAGRTYTLEATATDAAGNRTIVASACVVPHDQK